jgi:hypothetical protein
MINTIDVGRDFFVDLVNRDANQGDGLYTAVEFRDRYLKDLMEPKFWVKPKEYIRLDFSKVEILGPSFANEAFAYFTQFDVKPDTILQVISFVNVSRVKLSIIKVELEQGYRGL